MINEHIRLLKEALITEFYRLYEQHVEHEIYACALVFSPYLLIEHLAISTERSLFSDSDEDIQYLAEADRWHVEKWRYHSRHQDCALNSIKFIFANYFKQTHMFGNPLLEDNNGEYKNNLDIFLDAFQQAKEALTELYGLDIDNVLFFISIPNQPKVEILSAQRLNSSSEQLTAFLKDKAPQRSLVQTNLPSAKIRLGQSDRDILIDLAQIMMADPYNYLEVAREAYLLTLESSYADTNPYVQKLIQNIAAMDSQIDGVCALEREDVLNQIAKIENASLAYKSI